MNEELKIIIRAVTSEAQKSIEQVKKELQGVAQESKSTSEKFSAAMKGIGKAAVIAVTAVTAIMTAVVAFGKSTLDTQKQMAQLNAAFQAIGKTATEAGEVYKNFYRFLGDSDTAIEASNLLIKLTQDEKNLTQWTKILQGVYASFPDSLPIEGLVESANETARVGVVTGNLADALNWAGASEDAFNEALAKTTSLEEREALIRNTLNGLYGKASEYYEKNNKALLEYNESQANLQRKLAELGKTITPLLTALNNLAAAIVPILKTTFETVLPYIAGFVIWLTEAINRTAALSGAIAGTSDATENLGNSVGDAMNNAQAGTDGLNSGLEDAKKNAEAAKKAMMGFDELNVVPSEKSNSTGSTGDLFGGDQDFSNVNALTGSIDEFKRKSEAIAKSIGEWMDKWGGILKVIGGILAALSIRNLLVQFAGLLGLGEKVAKVLSFSGIAGALGKFAGWLKTVVALMKEGNGFFAVMGAAFPKLAGWIGKIVGAFKGFSFKGLLAGIKSVGSKFGWIGAIIVAVIAAIQYAVENWQTVCDVFRAWVDDNITPKIQQIKQLFKDMGEAITSAIPASWVEWLKGAWEWIKGAVAWLGDAIAWLWDKIGGIVFHTSMAGIMSTISTIIEALKGLVQTITGIVQFVVGLIETLVKTVKAIFDGNWEAVLEPLKKMWEGIKNIFGGLYSAVVKPISEFWNGVVDWFRKLWDVLVGHSIIPDTINAIIDWFKSLPGKVFEFVKNFVEGVINFFADLANKIGTWAINIWDKIKAPFMSVGTWFSNRWTDIQKVFSNVGSWFSDIFSKAYSKVTGAFSNAKTGFSNIWSNIKSGFGNVSDWFKNTFSKAWEAVKNVFSKGGKIFDGIKDGILSGLKAVINGLIGGINKVIKIPFDGINKALKKLKDISILGVEPFGWVKTISVPQIPLLAKGGIVDRATLAMIGEQGKEAVVPLENNTAWIDKLAEKLAPKNDTPAKIVLMLDGRELGQATIKSINDITRQTGALQLTLA